MGEGTDRRRVEVCRARRECREVRHAPDPGDEGAHQHRQAAPQSDEMPNPKQRERQEKVEARDPALSHAEVANDVAGEDPGRRDQGERPGDDRTPQQRTQARAAFFHARAVLAAAHLEHLGAGDAFGIGQIRLRDQRATQGNRVHNAERAAEQADGKAHPVGKASPPADHDQTGQHEDDRGERAGRGGDRLHDVVLLDRRAAEGAQHGHRDHGGRYRGGKGESRLEPEVDVGGGEHQGDEHTQDQATQRQFGPRFHLHIVVLPLTAPATPAVRRMLADITTASPPDLRCARRTTECGWPFQAGVRSASSSAAVSGFRKKDSAGMRRASTP